MSSMSANDLQKHMLGTYFGLRAGLAAIGIALPLVVWFGGGVLHHVWWEPSISRYYHTAARFPFLTTRDFFVGGLFAAAGCLYVYKGYGDRENRALNLAAMFAAIVALLPTTAANADPTVISKVHQTSAVLFFLCLAYVSLLHSHDTLTLLAPERRLAYVRRYTVTGWLMALAPVAAVVLSYVLEPVSKLRTVVFWVESIGVWAFAAYWIVKTLEMRESQADELALEAGLRREVVTEEEGAADMPVGRDDAGGAPGQKRARKRKQVERIVPADRSL